MIRPINNHVQIEPCKQSTFMATDKVVYDEVGIVVASSVTLLNEGDRVYFDSWMASKFPKEGSTEEFYWLVPFENIKAYESSLSKINVQGGLSSQIPYTLTDSAGATREVREVRSQDDVPEQHPQS